MDPIELRQQLEQAGFQLKQFSEESLQDLPFCEEDMLLFSECGLPKDAAPDFLYFAQGVAPEEGQVIRRLSDEYEQFKAIGMAKMIFIFAQDGAGNVFWIHTMSGHQVTMKDNVENMNRYVNDSLSSFLQSILLFRQFQLKYANAETRSAAKISELAGADATQEFRASLEAIDNQVFSDEFNYWNYVMIHQ